VAHDVVSTARLDLVSLTPELLEASLAGERGRVERALGASLPEGWPADPSVLRLRLEQLRRDPGLQPFVLRAIVLRDGARVVGHIGFHSRPGPAYLDAVAMGGIELGYTVFPEARRRGYAREAVTGLIDWAARVHGVTRFVLSIGVDNAPSLALAHQLGFEKVGSVVDESDGPEDVYLRVVRGAPLAAREVP
jgi:RimJ/RimL family protein N-acetyltransferase